MLENLLPSSWFESSARRVPAFSPALPEDESYMRLALFGARSGDPGPNPRVGAVVAARGRILSVAHRGSAHAQHAELAALAHAGLLAMGATLYVTLEPCHHGGRAAPCVDAIVNAGIARVVIGCPNPIRELRGGAARLLRKGVRVACGVSRPSAERLIADWRRAFELDASLKGGARLPDASRSGAAHPQVRHRLRIG